MDLIRSKNKIDLEHVFLYNSSARKSIGALLRRRRLVIILRKEVMLMPITLTFHVMGYTFTLRITRKSNNRHSAK